MAAEIRGLGDRIQYTRHTVQPRSGLLGIILPTYPRPPGKPTHYYYHTIPPRLHDNIQCGFAEIRSWSDDPDQVNRGYMMLFSEEIR